jgi:hypothetical protein
MNLVMEMKTAFGSISIVGVRPAFVPTAPSITDPPLEPPELPSEQLFEDWAQRQPRRLVRLLTADLMDAADTALAAEIAGRMLSPEQVVPSLLALLGHASQVVRESSVYGLAPHASDRKDVKSALIALLRPETEPSAAVRDAATDVLAWLDK